MASGKKKILREYDGLTKLCCVCFRKLPLNNFYKKKRSFDGLMYSCKECTLKMQKVNKQKYRMKNKSKILLWNREYQRNKRISDPHFVERQRIACKNYYYSHKEELNKKRIIYSRENPIGRAINFRHQNKRNGIILQFPKISLAELHELYKQSKDRCYYCGKILNGKFEYDHYIPLAKDGKHLIDNLRISCKKCNRSKRDKMPEVFALTYLSKIWNNGGVPLARQSMTL